MPCMFQLDKWHILIFLPTIYYALYIPGRYDTDSPISPKNLVCPLYSWQIRDRYTYFSKQFNMPCTFLSGKWQNHLFHPTIWYALYIPARYVTDSLFLQIISCSLFIPGIYDTDSPNFPKNLVCPLYSWQIRERQTYFSQQFNTPCIFLSEKWQIHIFLPTT